MKCILLSMALIVSSNSYAQLPERPPQYVMMAFDGSYSLSMWQETLDLAKNQPFRFTYFISGTYFLLEKNKLVYTEPTHGPGKSAIGWGGSSVPNLIKRVGYVNEAFDEGHEIASHANGHFDGGTWTLPQWNSEITQFYHLIFDIYKINAVPSPVVDNPFHFNAGEIVGFRAPLLGRNASMYQTLNDFHYSYDTSQTAATNYWPQIKNTVWNFPLADLRIAGSGKRTLSMDYNFYFTQSKGLPDPKNYKTYKTEMMNTYRNYFKGNYYGNRAPLNIGHHFSKWNDGAYWDALKDFSQEICGLPEVKCVNYKEYLAYVSSLDPATLAAYQKGEFEKLPPEQMLSFLRETPAALEVDLELPLNTKGDQLKIALKDPQHALARKSLVYVWQLNGREIFRSANTGFHLGQIRSLLRPADVISVALLVENKEIQKTSHKVLRITTNRIRFDSEDLELESLKGDMPAAHLNEPL
ncbi:MAG: hypothetical protein H7326_01110 [Bdellovibrionaceae bacterium]|nr:hypothetical protein [Pseudobdellovibrionaceae bacterium]